MLKDCTEHAPHRDALGIVPTCPQGCEYWQARREFVVALSAKRAAAPPGIRIVCQNTAPAAQVTRTYLAPLINEPSAAKALKDFAAGKVDALELGERLTAASKKTGTTAVIVQGFVTRAICAKFGLAMPEATAPETAPVQA